MKKIFLEPEFEVLKFNLNRDVANSLLSDPLFGADDGTTDGEGNEAGELGDGE